MKRCAIGRSESEPPCRAALLNAIRQNKGRRSRTAHSIIPERPARHSALEFHGLFFILLAHMSAKYTFDLSSEERRRALPGKIIVGQGENESARQVLLKFLAFVLFHRDRLQIEPRLPDDNIPFDPDLVQLDYELRPRLWVECGDCGTGKLNKLAVKVPEAEIWIMKRSRAEAEELHQAMAKAELRRGRYGVIGLDAEMFDEMCRLLAARNQFYWVGGDFDPPQMKFDFNGLWFDTPFTLLRF